MSSSLATFLRFTWLSDLLQDIRCALRMLVKSPGFALAAIVVLGLGIGGTTAMFSVIHATLLKPLPFQEPGQLVFARNSINGQINTVMSGPDYYDYREQADHFDGFSAVLGGAPEATVTGDSEPEHVAFTYIEHDLFRTLGVGPLAGRSFAPEEGRAGGPPVAMVSERFARRRFHDPDHAAGAPLTMDGNPYTVVGVMPAAFRFIHDNVDVWLPIHRGEGFAGAPRQFHVFFVTGRLKPGVSRENAQRPVGCHLKAPGAAVSILQHRQDPAAVPAPGRARDPADAATDGVDGRGRLSASHRLRQCGQLAASAGLGAAFGTGDKSDTGSHPGTDSRPVTRGERNAGAAVGSSGRGARTLAQPTAAAGD